MSRIVGIYGVLYCISDIMVRIIPCVRPRNTAPLTAIVDTQTALPSECCSPSAAGCDVQLIVSYIQVVSEITQRTFRYETVVASAA